MFYNRYRGRVTGRVLTLYSGETHEEAQSLGRRMADQALDYLGTFALPRHRHAA